MSNRSNKIHIQNIDPYTEDVIDNIDPYKLERRHIADKLEVPIQSVEFRWHSSIGETVIYVNDAYHGYVVDIWDGVLI